MTTRHGMSLLGWSTLAVLYALLWVAEWIFQRLPEPTGFEWWAGLKVLADPFGTYALRFGLVILAALIAGSVRVLARNPMRRGVYREWLAMTPWRPGLPLPRGSLLLGWPDLLIVAAVTAVTVIDLGWPVFAWPVLYGLAYTFTLWRTTPRDGVLMTVVAFLWPASFFPFHRWEIATAMIAATFAIILWTVRDRLRHFPFNDTDWRSENEVAMREAKQLGYPFSVVGPGAAPETEHRGQTLVRCLLITWYLLAGIDVVVLFPDNPTWGVLADSLIDQSESRFVVWWYIAVLLLVLIRWGRLRSLGGPPIGVFGRVFTGRWLIPQYDVIYLGPLLTAATGLLMPYVLHALGLPAQAIIGLTFFATFSVFALSPPNRENWQLMGQCRLVRQTSLNEDNKETAAGK